MIKILGLTKTYFRENASLNLNMRCNIKKAPEINFVLRDQV